MNDLSGKIIVIKYGGNAMLSESHKKTVISDIVELSRLGARVVMVHGGGPEIDSMLKKTGKESRFINGLRYTDQETMDIVQMVLCGKLGKDLSAMICRMGGKALGLCGFDGTLIHAVKLEDEFDYGLVGNIVKIETDIIFMALDHGYIPVISSIAMGQDAETAYNVNADTAASKIAAALGAEKLVLLTDVPGLLKDPADHTTLLPHVKLSEIPALLEQGIISGGMIPKIDCCKDAINQGVKCVHILDGRKSILNTIKTGTGTASLDGTGTMVTL